MKTIIIVVVLTLAGITAFGFVNQVISAPTIDPGASLTGEARTVQISGEVMQPGTYAVSEFATLGDLVDAANGLNGNADRLAFDLSYVLKGDSYYIAPLYDNSDVCATTPIEKVNINTGSAEDLKEIAGFNKTVAAAIVEYRQSNPFKAIEELLDVSGIGPATFTATKNKVTIKSA